MKLLSFPPITSLLIAASAAASKDGSDQDHDAIKSSFEFASKDWASQRETIACTVDIVDGHPSLVDESACALTKEDSSHGQSCVWCDATSTVGSGLCISNDQKSMMSGYWDQFCVTSRSTDIDELQQWQHQSQQELSTSLSQGDWLSQLACNVDIGGKQPSLIDEKTCSSTKDTAGQSCVWCDASSTIGSGGGVCVSPDQKAMLGQYWDQLCSAEGTNSSSPPLSPPPPPPPTLLPTPSPVPVPSPDEGNSIPDELKCTMDASSNVISDEISCIAQKDTNGRNCVWCQVPILGGTCITAQMKSAINFLCSSTNTATTTDTKNPIYDETLSHIDTHIMAIKGKSYLRGDGKSDEGEGGEEGKENDEGWKTLDSTCLGNDNGLVGSKKDCASKIDTNGNACIWCDAGNDVFGICATTDETDYLSTYLNCNGDANNNFVSEDDDVYLDEMFAVK